MIQALAVDDEPLAIELIETFCKEFDFINFQKGFTNTSLAKQHIERNPVDLIFLDIQMPAISGIDFYNSLPYKPMLVFTTSYSDYALQGYELNALDYLLKPFTFARFEKAVNKARNAYNLINNANAPDESKFILLKVDHGVVKITLSDILFIEGLDNYLKIHLQGSAPVVARLTLKAMMDKLNEKAFVRVHRSYIVPLARIESYKQKILTVAGEDIPVGKIYEETLKAILQQP